MTVMGISKSVRKGSVIPFRFLLPELLGVGSLPDSVCRENKSNTYG